LLDYNKKRRAVYQYYREAGKTPEEARALRNRHLKVWRDHTKAIKAGKKISAPKVNLEQYLRVERKEKLYDIQLPEKQIKRLLKKYDTKEIDELTSKFEHYWQVVEANSGKSRQELFEMHEEILTKARGDKIWREMSNVSGLYKKKDPEGSFREVWKAPKFKKKKALPSRDSKGRFVKKVKKKKGKK
jgi:hypothetical protein